MVAGIPGGQAGGVEEEGEVLGVPAPNARRRAIRSSPRCAVGYLLLSLTHIPVMTKSSHLDHRRLAFPFRDSSTLGFGSAKERIVCSKDAA
jgi:hypothetical protein